jgi:hypothetical protein
MWKLTSAKRDTMMLSLTTLSITTLDMIDLAMWALRSAKKDAKILSVMNDN